MTGATGRRAAVAVVVAVVAVLVGAAPPAAAQAEPDAPVWRVAGATRDQTGIAVSQQRFPLDGSAGAVVLARNDQFADALAGTPLAMRVDGPLLITPPAALDPEVQGEIDRVLPAGAPVLVLGGPAAVSDAVVAAVEAGGHPVTRLAGATRWDTAVAVARALGEPAPLLLATGLDFADALAAGAAAAHAGGAVLLTNGPLMPAATSAYLATREGVPLLAVGGPAAEAAFGEATPLVGTDRYATAALVAGQVFTEPGIVGVASGATFPDALTGGAGVAAAGGPMLLTAPDSLAPPAADYLAATASVGRAVLFGGPAAVSTTVEAALVSLLGAR